ncbi:MAG: hypothetical protein J6V25_11835 [Oscillospiraceae bacterium]|nr:hypothetical protein [Oscillospiraceae bacterium]
MKKWGWSWVVLAAFLFFGAVSRLEARQVHEGRQQLEELLRRTAVSCYACEGFYPPSVEYMQVHYGLQFDESNYEIRYERYASNLMPEITVLEK